MLTLLLPTWLKRLVAKIIFRRTPKEIRCPGCFQVVAAVPITPEALWDTRLDCHSCGTAFSHSVAFKTGSRSAPEQQIATISNRVEVARPTDSRIEVAEKEGVRGWHLPPRKGCNFLLGFGFIWTLFTLIFFSIFACAARTPGQDGPIWIVILMGGLFVLIGVGILFAGIRMSRIRHWVWVTADALMHEKQFFGTKRQIFQRSGIRSVELVVLYTQNYQPVHGIEIVGAEGKLRFGSGLSADDKVWLCQDIRRALGWDGAAAEAPEGSAAPKTAQRPFKSSFSIDRQPDGDCIINGGLGSQTTILIFVGLFFALVASFMIYNGPDIGFEDSPLPFRVFEMVFAVLWYVPLTAFALVGLAVCYTAFRLRQVGYELKANRNGVELEIRNGRGSVLHRHWPPQSVYSVQVRSISNSKNGPNAIGQQFVEIATADRTFSIGGDATEPELNAAVEAIVTAMEPWQQRANGMSQSGNT